MCGITGYIGDFDSQLLERMTQKIAHRGPDDQGFWYSEDKSIGLGHQRLAILDLSPAGHQPMSTADNEYVICYNGEIYNFPELKKELISHNISFQSNTDTEVILKGYAKFGFSFIERLNGIFALAIYCKADHSLLLVRDGWGIKPLYLAQTPRGFLFSSEMKSLFCDPTLSKEIDPQGVSNYLSFLWSPGETTLLKSVKKVLPGEAIYFKNGEIKKKWFFYDIPVTSKTLDLSEPEAIEKLDQHLDQAVRRQLIADVPVGAFLSGGLDSSSICHYARKNLGKKFECFSIDLCAQDMKKEGFANDLPYARQVAKHLDVNLNIIEVGSDSIYSLDKMLYHLDEPQADPAILNCLFITKLARENSIKVLLSGAGGDDLFTGYRRHYALMQEKYWSELPLVARRGIKNMTAVLPSGHPMMRRIKKAFSYADYDGNERLASYFLWGEPNTIINLLNSDFATINENQILSPLQQTLCRLPDEIPELTKMLYLENKHFLGDHNLNYTDKMSMANGVETRVPFLDKDLVEFAFALPNDLKQRGREGKYLLKKAMEKYLPNEIIYRSKTGFGAPLRKWLSSELRPLLDQCLNETTVQKRGIFNYQAIQRLRNDNETGRQDASYTLFALVCLERWFQLFLDEAPQ